jgi:hypothetical protein
MRLLINKGGYNTSNFIYLLYWLWRYELYVKYDLNPILRQLGNIMFLVVDLILINNFVYRKTLSDKKLKGFCYLKLCNFDFYNFRKLN